MLRFSEGIFCSRRLLGIAALTFSMGIATVFGQVVTVQSIASFNGLITGLNPSGNLCLGPDGNYYGATGGGSNGYGAIFRITTNGAVSWLTSFNLTNGANPNGLVLGPDGNSFYGTTQYGGQFSDGVVFRMSLAGAVTPIAHFNSTNGANPSCGLKLATDGNLYGVTTAGGASNLGTAFRVTTNGVLTTLVNFTGTNGSVLGSAPDTAFIQGSDGFLYSTTSAGGTQNGGTVFRAGMDGSFTNLFTFVGKSTGVFPHGVTFGNDGALYGTTFNDGNTVGGAFYRLTTNASFTRLLQFNGTNGYEPNSALCLASDGNFYGVTTIGGIGYGQPSPGGNTNGFGMIYRVSTNGTLTRLFSFSGTNGSMPQTLLMQGADGQLYGTTQFGGLLTDYGYTNSGSGTVFKITTNGVLTTLASFYNDQPNTPYEPMVQLGDGNFYGTTEYGGTNGGYGTVFRVSSQGGMTTLASFDFTNGVFPYGLTLGPNGNLYGVTTFGGTNNFAVGGDGTVFKLTTNGQVTPLVSFTGNISPEANLLTLTSNGVFYGTTYHGGTFDNGLDGSLFTVTTNGVLTTLWSFNEHDTNVGGGPPGPPLVLGPNNLLYGVNLSGGAGGYGTVFVATTNGTASLLAAFNGTNGAYPIDLILGNDGSFYGTTLGNGQTDPSGSIFKVTTNGVVTSLASFNITNGATPLGLTIGRDGNLYGVAQSGGTYGDGAVYELTTNYVFKYLGDFDFTNGATPEAKLTLGNDGKLYGTTGAGGAHGAGTVFVLVFHPQIVSAAQTNNAVTLNVATTVNSTNRLWAATNVALPFSQWLAIATNAADINGQLQFTDNHTAGIPAKFYRVSTP